MRGKKITNDNAFSLGFGGFATGFGGMLYETEEQNKARRPFNLLLIGTTLKNSSAS